MLSRYSYLINFLKRLKSILIWLMLFSPAYLMLKFINLHEQLSFATLLQNNILIVLVLIITILIWILAPEPEDIKALIINRILKTKNKKSEYDEYYINRLIEEIKRL